ncbi:PAS domain-containing protein [Pedococcus sp. NPDC057267]|uniref:PAS domain-containing protein n=1 Tax=Pedococcus sp. NPDC057267 TaxID=3346077 RepID=UPI003631F230
MLSVQLASAIANSSWFQTGWAPYVLLDADLTIREVNAAFEQVVGYARDAVVEQPLFDLFPDNPADPTGSQVALLSSLQHVLRTGRRQWMGVQRYDVADPARGGAFSRRLWIPVNIPVLDDGRVVGVLNHSQDVSVPLSKADRAAYDAFRPGELEAAADVLLTQFPEVPPSVVLSTLAHSQRRILEATGHPDASSALELARLRLEVRTGRPAGGDEGEA